MSNLKAWSEGRAGVKESGGTDAPCRTRSSSNRHPTRARRYACVAHTQRNPSRIRASARLSLSAAARAALTMSATGTSDPRMLEHAVNAMSRVLDVMRGKSASSCSPTAYGLLGYAVSCIAGQSLIAAPLRAASLFHGPALAEDSMDIRAFVTRRCSGRLILTFMFARDDNLIPRLDVCLDRTRKVLHQHRSAAPVCNFIHTLCIGELFRRLQSLRRCCSLR